MNAAASLKDRGKHVTAISQLGLARFRGDDRKCLRSNWGDLHRAIERTRTERRHASSNEDIARDLGVSVVTVSKVVRNHRDIGPETGERVLRRMRRKLSTLQGAGAIGPVATAALQAILDRGLRIPEDIAIIGYGNCHRSAFLVVPFASHGAGIGGTRGEIGIEPGRGQEWEHAAEDRASPTNGRCPRIHMARACMAGAIRLESKESTHV